MKNLTNTKQAFFFLSLIALSINFAKAQDSPGPRPVTNYDETGRFNPIPTAVPFLLIGPDSRAGALGDLGVASTPDANSTHWNNAKYAFIPTDAGISLSYSPWMLSMGTDMTLLYLSGYKRINTQSTLALSLLYFNLGNFEFTDEQAMPQGDFKPYEMSVDATYSMKLTEQLSAGLTGRYIRSDITAGYSTPEQDYYAGNAGAVDIGLYWSDVLNKNRKYSDSYAIGLAITNLGSKIAYSDDQTSKAFLPTNLRLGGRYTFAFDEYNDLSLMLDLNKLLVPTPPIYAKDSANNYVTDADGNKVIAKGMDPNVGIMQGMIQSFYDAPGGFSEEMKEINFSIGAEYLYNKMFAVRLGYYYQSPSKGDQQYLTIGAGLRYSSFALDMSYLIPFSTNNPLKNTLRFTLSLDLGKSKG